MWFFYFRVFYGGSVAKSLKWLTDTLGDILLRISFVESRSLSSWSNEDNVTSIIGSDYLVIYILDY
jgi:hypothetical protein